MTDINTRVDLGGIIVGVDTHKDNHVAVAVDPLGRLVAQRTVATDHAGLVNLLDWSKQLDATRTWGVEGTGSYGAGLTRLLRASGEPVHEVSRPNRRLRRARGKSDPIDAEAAARSVLAEHGVGAPKANDNPSESLRQRGRLAAPRSKPVPRQPTFSRRCWSPHQTTCAPPAPAPR